MIRTGPTIESREGQHSDGGRGYGGGGGDYGGGGYGGGYEKPKYETKYVAGPPGPPGPPGMLFSNEFLKRNYNHLINK